MVSLLPRYDIFVVVYFVCVLPHVSCFRKKNPILSKKHDMETRLNMKYVINKARSQKYKFSAIPQMQRKLNMDYDIKVKQFKECMKRSKQSDI